MRRRQRARDCRHTAVVIAEGPCWASRIRSGGRDAACWCCRVEREGGKSLEGDSSAVQLVRVGRQIDRQTARQAPFQGVLSWKPGVASADLHPITGGPGPCSGAGVAPFSLARHCHAHCPQPCLAGPLVKRYPSIVKLRKSIACCPSSFLSFEVNSTTTTHAPPRTSNAHFSRRPVKQLTGKPATNTHRHDFSKTPTIAVKMPKCKQLFCSSFPPPLPFPKTLTPPGHHMLTSRRTHARTRPDQSSATTAMSTSRTTR